MADFLEKQLAYYCGAVLLGKKPAALFSLKDEAHMAENAAALLAENGLGMQVMWQKQGRTLLLAYEPQQLARALAHPLARRLLAQRGYPIEGQAPELLRHLQACMQAADAFPHEIGFFLGYPPPDVVGFMLYGGRRPKHCCMWKVYSDVERAKRLCDEFRACCALCRSHIEQGGSLRTVGNLVVQAG